MRGISGSPSVIFFDFYQLLCYNLLINLPLMVDKSNPFDQLIPLPVFGGGEIAPKFFDNHRCDKREF
ncbi:MAG: hypothetical protein CO120_02700 [Gammaproteobacteria bacterium CG_4_9_14_3_um_filter_38_9]|nr:MAG: hypothetical protein CO120_02700 [Gammaproteobacteria bacterium CG_4_9_14_3_um_filter_38_9]